jgi:hypothetical protein
MRPLLTVVAALVAGLAWTSPAIAETGRVTTVDLSRDGATYRASAPIPRFTLAGLQWRGPGDVLLRTRSTSGLWSAWRPAAPEDEDGPDRWSGESVPTAWRTGNPWWTGESNGIEARAVGRVTRVRATLVWSPEVRVPYRRLVATETPAIVSRASWGADEAIRRAPPSYARELRFAVVHHTAGENDYSRAEAPAIVRAIQLYHVQGNGWNDVGYNFLVDRFGTVYEGRFGGVDRNVVGAHAQGFNTGSVGVAVLGTYGGQPPSRAAQEALTGLLAWRLDVAHVDPISFVGFVSGGSDRYPSGVPALLSAVSGHRDTGFTECPGDGLYARLGTIAAQARATGGQKVFEPKVDVAGSSVRIRAKLAQSGPWSVVVSRTDATEVGRGSGLSSAVDWTWDATSASPGTYRWTLAAGDARPATGSLRAGTSPPTVEIVDAAVEPAAITPNGDGQADTAVVSYRLTTAAIVSVEVTDAFGNLVVTVTDRVLEQAGTHSVAIAGDALPDGRYFVVVTARSQTGSSVQATLPLAVSRTLGFVAVEPTAISPNGDGRSDELVVTFPLTVPASVRLRIERDGRWVATPFTSALPAGSHRLTWDGTRPSGALRDGAYAAVVETQDAVGAVAFAVNFSVDTTPPRVKVLAGSAVRVEVSEAASLTVRIDGSTVRRDVLRPGVVRIPWVGPALRVRAVARDAAGNASAPAVRIRKGREPGQ